MLLNDPSCFFCSHFISPPPPPPAAKFRHFFSLFLREIGTSAFGKKPVVFHLVPGQGLMSSEGYVGLMLAWL